MYQTADGKKKFGSAYVGKRYDENHKEAATEEPVDEKDTKKKLGKVLSDKSGELAEEMGEKQDNPQEEEQEHPVVAQHGKAKSVHINHDHAANRHHVTSVHEDGHTNESDHESAEDAHGEGRKLAGLSAGPEAESEPTPGEGGGMEEDGFDMPSL